MEDVVVIIVVSQMWQKIPAAGLSVEKYRSWLYMLHIFNTFQEHRGNTDSYDELASKTFKSAPAVAQTFINAEQ